MGTRLNEGVAVRRLLSGLAAANQAAGLPAASGRRVRVPGRETGIFGYRSGKLPLQYRQTSHNGFRSQTTSITGDGSPEGRAYSSRSSLNPFSIYFAGGAGALVFPSIRCGGCRGMPASDWAGTAGVLTTTAGFPAEGGAIYPGCCGETTGIPTITTEVGRIREISAFVSVTASDCQHFSRAGRAGPPSGTHSAKQT